MSHAEIVAAVRLKAVEAFRHFRLSDGDEPREAILLSEDKYCGRRLEAARGYAVWDAQRDELRIFRAGDVKLATIPLASSTAAKQAAA